MPQPKPIRSQAGHERALARIASLMGADPDTPEGRELGVLADLVDLYERRQHALGDLDPVDAIRLRMEEESLSPHDLVPFLGSSARVSEVLARKRPLTLPMARALNRHMGIPAEVLLREPHPPESWDDDHWRRFPLRAMADRGWIPKVPGLAQHARELMEGLRERAGARTDGSAAIFRRSGLRANAKADAYALQAWCRQAMAVANRNRPSAEYVPGTVTPEALLGIARLSRSRNGPSRVASLLADLGIAFVTLPHLPRTYLDGAALQLADGSPVVALTLRHDRIDNFWFCLLHELAHVARHMDYDSPAAFLDDQSLRRAPSPGEDPREAEADEWAEEALIPGEEWEAAVVRIRPTAINVIHFAEEIGVHPAIVAGRVRFERDNYRLLSQFVGSGAVRRQFS